MIKEHRMDEKLQEEMSEAPVDHGQSLRKIGDQLNTFEPISYFPVKNTFSSFGDHRKLSEIIGSSERLLYL